MIFIVAIRVTTIVCAGVLTVRSSFSTADTSILPLSTPGPSMLMPQALIRKLRSA
jgi:hypothetical protein